MRTRDLLILILVLAFGGAVGVVLFGDDAHGGTLAPAPDEAPPPAVAPDVPKGEPVPAVLGQGAVVAAAAVAERAETVDTTGWEKGMVMGDIELAVSVLDRIESITVAIEELRNPIQVDGKYEPPFKAFAKVERGLGTPTFRIRDIPFSAYPYSVSVYSPGLSGSSRTITIDEHKALHDDIVLRITPGAPFSILVRDQDGNPYRDVDVRMVPVGQPAGRRQHIGKTDNYGSVVFEDVLAGDYRLVSTQQGLPLTEPEVVTVMPGARLYGSKVQGQGYPLVVQRGMPLEVSVSRGGYGIADATVKLHALDRTDVVVLEKPTDYGGMVTFPHLAPGRWMVQVTKADHDPWTRPLTIVDGELPPRLEVRLVRLR